MNSDPKSCPACGGSDFSLLADFGTVPRSGTFLESREESFPTLQLSFDYCTTCALLRQNWRGESIPHDYREVPRATSRQLPSYTAQIADSLKKRGIGPKDLIVEVGANDGAFLELLSDRGFVNLIGIEPSKACADSCRKKGYRVKESYLDDELSKSIRIKHGPARAVICRHTLEHVPNPSGFLKNMRQLLADEGILFVEVPSSHTIIHDLYGYELWDEHLHIFSPENLAQAVSRAGFDVLSFEAWPLRGTENILLWAIVKPPARLPSCEYRRDINACAGFMAQWSRFSRNLDGYLAGIEGSISAIGASHPQSNFWLFTKLGNRIDQLIDDDPVKIGRFVPIPKPVPVISSKQHVLMPSAAIVMSAFGYDQWMNSIVEEFICKDVRIICPYSPRRLLESHN